MDAPLTTIALAGMLTVTQCQEPAATSPAGPVRSVTPISAQYATATAELPPAPFAVGLALGGAWPLPSRDELDAKCEAHGGTPSRRVSAGDVEWALCNRPLYEGADQGAQIVHFLPDGRICGLLTTWLRADIDALIAQLTRDLGLPETQLECGADHPSLYHWGTSKKARPSNTDDGEWRLDVMRSCAKEFRVVVHFFVTTRSKTYCRYMNGHVDGPPLSASGSARTP